MSSFRPDFEPQTLDFAPIRFAAAASEAFAASEPAGQPAAPATPEPAPSESESEPTAELHTAAELAEREQAAFERGVESAAVEAAAVEAAYRTLAEAGAALRVAAATEPSINREKILELAALIATRWVGSELRDDAARFAEVVDRAFEAAGPSAAARLWLHAEDRDRLLAGDDGRLAEWTRSRNVDLMTDEELGRGEFRIEMPRSIVDGRFETIRQRLEEALGQALAAPRPEVTD
jgi:flagellar biosynthesis/type III secretory pathway protein FliH